MLISLLIINKSFVLAYEIKGPVWSFKTGADKTLIIPTVLTAPANPEEPNFRQGGGKLFINRAGIFINRAGIFINRAGASPAPTVKFCELIIKYL